MWITTFIMGIAFTSWAITRSPTYKILILQIYQAHVFWKSYLLRDVLGYYTGRYRISERGGPVTVKY